MTEKEFWNALDKALNDQIKRSVDYRERFMKRLINLLIDHADAMRNAADSKRVKLLKQLFVDAGYNDYWNLIQDAFDQIHANANDHWNKHTIAQTDIPRTHARLAALEKISFSDFGELGNDSVRHLDRTFRRAVKEGWDKQQLIDSIRPIGAKTAVYAETIADASLRGWDSAITATKAEIAKVDEAKYDGPALRENSHQFCIDHYQQIYTRAEIEGMSNGVIDPVIIYRGGYRCVHRWRWLVLKILK